MKKKIGEYVIEELIGSGAYGEVYKGSSTKKMGEQYAIKMISKKNMSEKVFHYLEREVEILQMLDHKNVVKLKDIKATDNHYYLIFEFCNGGDLSNFRKIKGGILPENLIRFVFRQVVAGLNELYNKKTIHRDLKLSNVLLSYPDEKARSNDMPIVKLGDFGFARLITHVEGNEKSISEQAEPMSFVGTPLNMAPELFHKEAYSFKADIWSLGTIIYELACGKNCYTGKNKEDLIRNIDLGIYRIPKALKLSLECMDILNECLQLNPTTRAKWKDVVNHNFIATDKYTMFDPKEFEILNNVSVDIFEESESYKFNSKIRYNFDIPKESVKDKEQKLIEEIKKLEIADDLEILRKSDAAEENDFIEVEKPTEVLDVIYEIANDYTAITTEKINIEENHFK